jgi:MoxR-like ATPase
VRSISRVFGLPLSRIQFTPDLMPADITGTIILERDAQGNSSFRFQPGPLFSHLVLADEINRATPKTQSALLEAMQEKTVSVGGVGYRLEEPFFVLATQNPIEQEGTYPLPEAQIDRFLFKLTLDFPSPSELKDIVLMTQASMDEVADAVLDGSALLRMRAMAKDIPIMDEVLEYALALVAATHGGPGHAAHEVAGRYLRMGASPRAGQALITAAKVRALLTGKFNVSYADIDALAYPVLRHRIKPNFEAIADKKTPDQLIADMLAGMKPRRGKRGA